MVGSDSGSRSGEASNGDEGDDSKSNGDELDPIGVGFGSRATVGVLKSNGELDESDLRGFGWRPFEASGEFDFVGTATEPAHAGHLTVRPANLSGIVSFLEQDEQLTLKGIGGSE